MTPSAIQSAADRRASEAGSVGARVRARKIKAGSVTLTTRLLRIGTWAAWSTRARRRKLPRTINRNSGASARRTRKKRAIAATYPNKTEAAVLLTEASLMSPTSFASGNRLTFHSGIFSSAIERQLPQQGGGNGSFYASRGREPERRRRGCSWHRRWHRLARRG